jgi:predicted Fe-Mo cluster-binding NifX family protein
MKKRILAPVEEPRGMESRIFEHFGRTPYFALLELGEGGEILRIEFSPNEGGHSGGGGFAHDWILKLSPEIVLVRGMGPRGLERLKSAGISVLETDGETLKDAVAAFVQGRLGEHGEAHRTLRQHGTHPVAPCLPRFFLSRGGGGKHPLRHRGKWSSALQEHGASGH